MKLLGWTMWNLALISALLNASAELAFACLQPELPLVSRGRNRGAVNWDGTGRCVWKAFGELSPVYCFLHSISNPLVPRMTCGRSVWSLRIDSSESPTHHCCLCFIVFCPVPSLRWASVRGLLRQGGLKQGLQTCAPLNSSLLTLIRGWRHQDLRLSQLHLQIAQACLAPHILGKDRALCGLQTRSSLLQDWIPMDWARVLLPVNLTTHLISPPLLSCQPASLTAIHTWQPT